MMNNVFQTLDWVVFSRYFVILLGIAFWVIRKKNNTSEEYFSARKNVGWIVIGEFIFASNIVAEHVVGLEGAGAESGMPMAHYELHAPIVLLLGWFFLPFYMRSVAFTTPEFSEKIFDSRSRWFMSLFSSSGYLLKKVSVTIYAGSIVVSQLLGIGFLAVAIIIIAVTGLYTILGSMRPVVYTETFQTIILLLGSMTITFIGLHVVGGWSKLKATAGSSHSNMWRPFSGSQFPWTVILFGGTIAGIWYWCTISISFNARWLRIILRSAGETLYLGSI